MVADVSRFYKNNSGAVAPLAGVWIVALLVCCGVSIDYSLSVSAKERLQKAADAAALAVVASAARSQGDASAIDAAKSEGYRLYAENAPQEFQARPTISVQYLNGRYDATVRYSVDRPNVFAGILPLDSLKLAGIASASQQAQFVDLHLVLDVSASMGLGASEDDQRRLYEQIGCQFGCHVSEAGPSNEEKAVSLGIPMRIDVLKSATHQFIADMRNHEAASAMRIALHVFHDQAEQVLPPTTDLAQAASLVNSLRIGMGRPRASTLQANGTTPDSGDTVTRVVADHIVTEFDHQGTGTRADPRKFLVMVTDGTQSTWSPGLETKPWEADTCRAIHDMDVQVAVIYLEYSYYGKEWDGTWPWAIAPIESQIEPNLRACANSGIFIKANDPAEIHAAFSRAFREIASRSAVHLTQ